MPIADSDPRVFFAAERTLLAWVRTGLTVMAFGFVVERFGVFMLFLSMQGDHSIHSDPLLSSLLGIALVTLGSLLILGACRQHRRFIRTLSAPDLPPAYSLRFAIWASSAMAVLGLLLSVFLALS